MQTHNARDNMPAILRAIDEIAFHNSMIALNLAIAAAGESTAAAQTESLAARETLALVEESLRRSQPCPPSVASGMEELRCMAERSRPTGATLTPPSRHVARRISSCGDVR
jgi:hypothetical protein